MIRRGTRPAIPSGTAPGPKASMHPVPDSTWVGAPSPTVLAPKKGRPGGGLFQLSVNDRNQVVAQASIRRPATPATSSSTRLITSRPQRLMVGITSGRPEQVTVKLIPATPRAGVVQLTSRLKLPTSGGVH